MMTELDRPQRGPIHAGVDRLVRLPEGPILAATIVLFVVSPFVAPNSLSAGALATTLPFAAVAAIAAVGQTLVVQQRGLDFSVAGMMSLSTVILCTWGGDGQRGLPVTLIGLLLVAVVVGLVNGIVITRFGITPLIATLGMNSLLIGALMWVSNGVQVPRAPDILGDLAYQAILGIPLPAILAALIAVCASIVVHRTIAGRRFESAGANPSAAHVAGVRVVRQRLAAYTVAAVLYAAASVVLVGTIGTPTLDVGNPYLLSSIAAVVVGGTALTGGTGSPVASAIGALFLTQLGQLLLAAGAVQSINFLIQALVIALSMAARSGVGYLRERRRRERILRPTADRADGVMAR